jgi:hypothetical protein
VPDRLKTRSELSYSKDSTRETLRFGAGINSVNVSNFANFIGQLFSLKVHEKRVLVQKGANWIISAPILSSTSKPKSPCKTIFGSERNHLGHQLLLTHSTEWNNRSLKEMNKKLLLGILCVAVIAISASAALSDTWLSKFKSIYVKTGSSQGICLYDDCNAERVAGMEVQAVQQGGSYEFAVYVLNTGTAPVYITYLPTDINTDGGQTRFHITVQVIGFGMPCEMIANNIPLPTGIASLPYNLPEKNVNTPTAGFPLNPNKMIKLDITVRCDSVDLTSQPLVGWKIPFEVVSVSV